MADNKRQVPSDYKRARKKRNRRDSNGMAGRDGNRISEVIDLTEQDDDIPTSRPKITKTVNLADSLSDIPMPPGKPPQTTTRLPDRDRPVDSQPSKPNLVYFTFQHLNTPEHTCTLLHLLPCPLLRPQSPGPV